MVYLVILTIRFVRPRLSVTGWSRPLGLAFVCDQIGCLAANESCSFASPGRSPVFLQPSVLGRILCVFSACSVFVDTAASSRFWFLRDLSGRSWLVSGLWLRD